MSGLRLAGLLLLVAAVWVVAGCQEAPVQTHPVTFRATVDGLRPLANVILSGGGRQLGRTGPDGSLVVELERRAEAVPIEVQCPDGYRIVDAPSEVRLRQFSSLGEGEVLEHSVECRPEQRQVVLVVLTELDGLEITVDGEPKGRTDAGGVAHLLVERPPGSTVTVQVDAGDRTDLEPSAPARLFEIADRDDIFVFEPAFSRASPKRPARRRARVVRRAPYRID